MSSSVDDERRPLLGINDQKPKLGLFTRRRRQTRAIRAYYDRQRHLLDCYEQDAQLLSKDDHHHQQESLDTASADRRIDSTLATITFVLNVVLLGGNATAAYLSHSLSIISAFIDSAMDITSGLVIWIALRAIDKTNPYEYPRGRSRLEPISVIIVSIIMGVANIMMIIQSLQSVINQTVNPEANLPTLIIMCVGIGLKLILYYFCTRQSTPSSALLAMDQRNDVVTSVVALAGALIGNYYWLYADPIGAVLVCTFIAVSWFYNAGDQIPLLSGKIADAQFIDRIIHVAITHDPKRIRCLDTIMVYHYGNQLLVELHIVMDPAMTLQEAHDISEPLQAKLERLPFVERAFVHCDWHCDGV